MTSRTGTRWLRTQAREVPVALVALLLGFVLLGGVGGVVGLLLGLHAHAPTAWFAVLEVGVPAAAVGGLLGLVAGVIVPWTRPGPTGPEKPGHGADR